MKRVSFEIAKIIKEAGYPQGKTDSCFDSNAVMHYTSSKDSWLPNDIYIDAPTYMEVWLWLWRSKNISIDIDYLHGIFWGAHTYGEYVKNNDGEPEYSDPEEAIAAAIKYLVENDLIK